jgi:ABC transporter DrrB family efflux protein
VTTTPPIEAMARATREHPTLSDAVSQSMVLAGRGVIKLRRHPMGLMDVIVGPAIFLSLFGYVFGGAISGDTDGYLQYIFPGMVGLMTLFATMGVAVSLSQDLTSGIFDRFRSLPLLRIAPLMGAIGSDVVRQVVSLTALVGFGFILGVRFETDLASVLAACGLALAFALALSWVWVLLALAIRDTTAVQGLAAVIIFPLAFTSNIFVPPETMPEWLQTIVAWNPVGHLVDALRGLMMGGPVAQPVLLTITWMAAFVLIFAPLSLRAYNRST